MTKNIDFSKGVIGKISNPDGEFNLPIYLDRDIAEIVARLSAKRKVDMSQFVN